MGVPKTSDHIKIKINMPTPCQEPPASSKAPNQDFKDMDVLGTFKIKIEGKNIEHRSKKTSDHQGRMIFLESSLITEENNSWSLRKDSGQLEITEYERAIISEAVLRNEDTSKYKLCVVSGPYRGKRILSYIEDTKEVFIVSDPQDIILGH